MARITFEFTFSQQVEALYNLIFKHIKEDYQIGLAYFILNKYNLLHANIKETSTNGS